MLVMRRDWETLFVSAQMAYLGRGHLASLLGNLAVEMKGRLVSHYTQGDQPYLACQYEPQALCSEHGRLRINSLADDRIPRGRVRFYIKLAI